MPFLYLPDAISLVLLILVLSLLRRLAVIHVRQELVAVKNELLFLWAGTGRTLDNAAHLDFCRQIEFRIALSADLTPARQYLVSRLGTRAVRSPHFEGAEGGSSVAEFEKTADRKILKKLLRLGLERDLSFGCYYFLGSISGWTLAFPLLCRLILHTVRHHATARVDCFFDLAERVLSRAGRRAYLAALDSAN